MINEEIQINYVLLVHTTLGYMQGKKEIEKEMEREIDKFGHKLKSRKAEGKDPWPSQA